MLNYKKYLQHLIGKNISLVKNKLGFEFNFQKIEEPEIFKMCHILQKINNVENVILNMEIKKAYLKMNRKYHFSLKNNTRNKNLRIKNNKIRINPELEDNC